MAQSDASVCDDTQLVRRILAGDQDAYRQIVVRYESRMIAFLTYMLGEPELARDICQDTFVAAYEALGQWRAEPDTLLGPWLYRIATNRALNAVHARKSRGGKHHPLASFGERPDVECSFEDQLALRELLTVALRQLTADDATCLVLRVVAGEPYGEIAARLGLTSEAVRKRVARGLVALRAAYLALDAEAHR
jgi:RNA polymerase sigma-70 factor, ECF subfamily